MRWICILLPHLALDGVLRSRADPAAPLVLVGGPAQRRVLLAANPAARARGLRAGQPLAAAQAISRDFVAIDHDPAEAAGWHRFLGAWAYGFSSQVSLQYPGALLVEIGASLSLLGPWPRLEARLRRELTALGFRHRIVAAPQPAAARVLANGHDGLALPSMEAMRRALAQMPVERAGLPREVATACARMGLVRLGQVLALPRESIARRFPAEVLRHLDAVTGDRVPALESYAPPDRFDARIEFGFEVTVTPALAFPLKRLTADLAAFLASRDGGVQRFVLHLEHAGAAATEVPVGLLSAERDAAMLLEMARVRLERVPALAPVQALRLVAHELPAFVPAHRELFDERPQQTLPWPQLRERLRARLGDAAVHGLRSRADHRPECAWQPEDEAGRTPPAAASPRPGWLLARPLPLREAVAAILAGPERIESGWWDGGDVRRDYYRVATAAGPQAWAWRPAGEDGPLMLHGWFA